MNVCGIDIGTKTGYAMNIGPNFQAGTWKLASASEVAKWGKERLTRRKDPRVERLCERFSTLPMFDVIVVEDVQFGSTTYQAHLWAGLRSAVWLCAKARHFDAVPVGTLKKFATGSGAADKDAMSAALKRQHTELWRTEYDDNAIDAIWLWLWGRKNLGRMPV
jgi:hypothetical protein